MKRGIALLTATRNRPAELRRLLDSIRAQTFRDVSIIVVDQSDDPSAQGIRQTLAELPNDLKYTYIKSATIGLSSARNIGVTVVDRQYVTFPDDDCWYEPDYCERIWKYFESHPGVQFVTGTYGETPYSGCDRPVPLTPLRALRRANSITLTVSTSAFSNVWPPFDVRLGVGAQLASGEETDLVLRLLAAGLQGRFEPSCFVYHPAQTRYLERQMPQRARAAAYIISRHAMNATPTLLPLMAFGLAKRSVLAVVDGASRSVHLAGLEGYWLGIRERLAAKRPGQ